MWDALTVYVRGSLIFGLLFSGCDRIRPPKLPVANVEPAQENRSYHVVLAAGDMASGASVEHGTRPESLRVQGASLLFRLIRPQGLDVQDFVCLDAVGTPEHFLEIMACWHPSHGWLEPHHCSDESYMGQRVRSLPRALMAGMAEYDVVLGIPMRVCEREVMKSGFVHSGEQKVWEAPVWTTSPSPADPVCEVRDTSHAERIAWSIAQLGGLRDVWGTLMSSDRARECDALMFASDGVLSRWAMSELEVTSRDSDVAVSDELVFPGAKPGAIQGLRSMVIEHQTCQVSVVWARREGRWEVLGLNESARFSSTRPFGEGPLDIASSVCSDLNGDGSPEIWFSSGYETMGGELLVELSGAKPEWLFSRYTGD